MVSFEDHEVDVGSSEGRRKIEAGRPRANNDNTERLVRRHLVLCCIQIVYVVDDGTRIVG